MDELNFLSRANTEDTIVSRRVAGSSIKNNLDRVLNRILRSRFSRIVDGFEVGSLQVEWPDGSVTDYGEPGAAEEPVFVKLHDYDLVKSLALNGSIGCAESYMHGHWSTDDLHGLFLLFLKNRQHFPSTIDGSWIAKTGNSLLHRWNRNTLSGSRQNISKHYDLGNDFYRLWLDESMSYSSGLYTVEDETLEQSQRNKIRLVLDAIEAQPGAKVLEIGCGWGAMANALTLQSNCEVTGISLSHEQLEYANSHVPAAADGSKADVVADGVGAGGASQTQEIVSRDTLADVRAPRFEFQDYRKLDGCYDHIVSIEMFEAVGREYWDEYFRTLSRLLDKGGSAVLQVITIMEERFDDYCRRPDFIQKYIFPGGMLPTKSHLEDLSRKHGFHIDNTVFFGQSYAATLMVWRKRFEASLVEVRRQGYDDNFIRMWRYYLAYCEAGFTTGRTDVGLWKLVKK